MKRKHSSLVTITVTMIILLIAGGCQLPGDENVEIKENVLSQPVDSDTEDNTGTAEPDTTTVSEPETTASEPTTTTTDEPTIMEVSMETYKDFTEYHFPTALIGKIIETENGQRYSFTADGITLPVDHKLYPNPVTPFTFNSMVDGATSESLTDSGDTYIYELAMSGKVEYKGNTYPCEIVIVAERVDGELTLNGTPATVVE